LYRRVAGIKLGHSSVIYNSCEIRDSTKIAIGDHSSIGDHCILDGRGGLTIGDSVNISTGVWIWTAQHDPQSADFQFESAPVVIENFAWLSCRSIILPGVRVGRGTVIAAGAVVTKDTPEYSIMAGIPAKKIGNRNQELTYKLRQHSHFW
jgi:acetyltransferase-like isoleucine patch superfamily enzyme